MKPVKIAITGRLRSGKDTVADILQEETHFTVYRFADGITDIIQQYFPDDWKLGKPREHYQVIGQSLRQLDENVWVKALHRKRQYAHLYCNELITDLRQPNVVADYVNNNMKSSSVNMEHVFAMMIALRISNSEELFSISMPHSTKIRFARERNKWIADKKLPDHLKDIERKNKG